MAAFNLVLITRCRHLAQEAGGVTTSIDFAVHIEVLDVAVTDVRKGSQEFARLVAEICRQRVAVAVKDTLEGCIFGCATRLSNADVVHQNSVHPEIACIFHLLYKTIPVTVVTENVVFFVIDEDVLRTVYGGGVVAVFVVASAKLLHSDKSPRRGHRLADIDIRRCEQATGERRRRIRPAYKASEAFGIIATDLSIEEAVRQGDCTLHVMAYHATA